MQFIALNREHLRRTTIQQVMLPPDTPSDVPLDTPSDVPLDTPSEALSSFGNDFFTSMSMTVL